jgi:hypothetical protein
MDYSAKTLGTRIVAQLRERVSTPVLIIGRDRYTRHDLAEHDCFNFQAAKRLNDAIAHLNVSSTRDLFKNVEPEALALPQIGAFAFAVLGTCFEQAGVGTLDDWVEQSRVKGTRVVTFATIKQHIAQHTTKTVRKTRTKARRNGTTA